jgi:hypothetical protein
MIIHESYTGFANLALVGLIPQLQQGYTFFPFRPLQAGMTIFYFGNSHSKLGPSARQQMSYSSLHSEMASSDPMMCGRLSESGADISGKLAS